MTDTLLITLEEKLHRENTELRLRNNLLQMELSSLKAETPSEASYYLQSKVDSQRKILNILHRRVRGQRLHLRTINELGRGLTVEEWNEAKAKYPEELEETLPKY